MKKQILFLAIFSLAVLAGTNNAWGQLLPGVTNPTGTNQPIDPLSCVAASLPLHPYPGISYAYTLTNGAGAVSANWTWWATKDPQFVNGEGNLNLGTQLTVASGALVATSASPVYGVDNRTTTDGSGTVNITWSADILAATEYQGDVTAAGTPAAPSPTFVVGYSEGVNCADNLQVFEINPMPNFTIDIAAIDTAAATPTLDWDVAAEQCVDDVQSAIYNNTNKNIDMDYGVNNFYFEVAATNFNTSWDPAFTIVSGLGTDQEAIINLYPTYADALAGTNVIAGGTSGILTDADLNPTLPAFSWDPDLDLTATNIADAATGVSLFVRVTVYNNTFESLAASPFVLAVDAQDFGGNAGGIWDMENTDCPGDPLAADEPDVVDNATMNILPRPTLQMDGASMGEPSTVTPEDVIEKHNP